VCWVSKRWKNRQCRSVQSIIGATDMRQGLWPAGAAGDGSTGCNGFDG
jgi:hypothetical protein